MQDKTGHWFWIKTVEGKTMPTGGPSLTQFPLMQIPLTCCLFYVSVKHLLGQDRALVFDQDRWGKNFCRMSSTYAISTNSDPTYTIFLFCFSLAFARTWPGIGFGSRLLKEKSIPLTCCSVSMLRIVANTNHQFQSYKLKKCKIQNKDCSSDKIHVSYIT